MILSSSSLSSITEKPSIIEDIDYILGTDTTSFPFAEKLRLINKWYLKVGMWIWDVDTSWKFDSSLNTTTLTRKLATIVANQLDYTIPTTALSIEKLEIKNKDGDYIEIEYKDEFDNIPENDEAGFPTQWKLEGRSIMLNKKPTADYVTLANGLRIFLSQQVTKFTKSDAAVSPGFEEQFHELLSKGPAFDFCVANSMYDKANVLKSEINEMKKDLEEFYSNRNKAIKPVVNPQRTNYL